MTPPMELVGSSHKQEQSSDLNLLSAFGQGFAKPFDDIKYGLASVVWDVVETDLPPALSF